MNACAPGTHFNTFDAARRYRCIWCGTTHVPTPDTRPRCGACGGLGIKSMTWLGTPQGDLSRWRLDNCDDCAGTGLLADVTSGTEAGGVNVDHDTDELHYFRVCLTDYQAAFERILTLHGPKATRGVTCKECAKPWPCPTTIAALAPERAATT